MRNGSSRSRPPAAAGRPRCAACTARPCRRAAPRARRLRPRRRPTRPWHRACRPRSRSPDRRCIPCGVTVTGLPAMVPDVSPKKGSSLACGTSRASRSRERGPWTASAPMSRLTSSTATCSRPTRSANQAKLGSAEVSRNSSGRAVLDDAVLQHESALVQPGRVVSVPRRAAADVARQHAGQKALRVAARRSGTCRAARCRRCPRCCARRSTRTCPTPGSASPPRGPTSAATGRSRSARWCARGRASCGSSRGEHTGRSGEQELPGAQRQADADGRQSQHGRGGDQPPVAPRHALRSGHACGRPAHRSRAPPWQWPAG